MWRCSEAKSLHLRVPPWHSSQAAAAVPILLLTCSGCMTLHAADEQQMP